MIERLPRSLALLGTFGLMACAALPCAATRGRHPAARSHISVSHSAKAHSSVSHVSASRTSTSRKSASRGSLRRVKVHIGRGRHATYVERAVAVHHEPAPAMDSTRATEIQAALIHAGYLSGEPSGIWDADSVSAMQKLQDANGWQTKYTPDSRALVKLGLGAAPFHPGLPTLSAEAAPATTVAQP